jgi:hypothetical protein
MGGIGKGKETKNLNVIDGTNTIMNQYSNEYSNQTGRGHYEKGTRK